MLQSLTQCVIIPHFFFRVGGTGKEMKHVFVVYHLSNYFKKKYYKISVSFSPPPPTHSLAHFNFQSPVPLLI